MMVELMTMMTVLPSQVLCLFPLRNQMRFRLRKTLGILGLLDLLLFPILAFLIHRYGIGIRPVAAFMMVIFWCAFQFCMKSHSCKSVAVVCAVYSLKAILRNAACAIEFRVMPETGADMLSMESAFIQIMLNVLGTCLLFYPFQRFGAKLIDQLNIPAIWAMTLPFSLTLLGLNLFLRPLKYETLFVNNVFRSFLVSVFATLLLWGLLCVMFYHVVTTVLTSADQKMRIRFLEMQESQFASQQRYMEASARARHDFRQSLLTMQSLCREGNYPALERYINEYYAALPQAETTKYCRNLPLNALLNDYAAKAKESKIRINFRIDLPDIIDISDVDLCTVTGNILENALTACMEIPEDDRYIQLTMLTQNENRLYLVATNSHSGRICQRNGKYLSTHWQGQGIGLRSVSETAEKYGGKAEFSHNDREFFSNVMMMLHTYNGSTESQGGTAWFT